MRYILKYILSLVFFITLFNSSVFAQGGYISLYQAGLNITLQDGKIPYKNDNKTTDVTGFVTFTKSIPDSLECNVSAIFVHRSTTGTETTISDSIRVGDSEFRTSISVPKNFTFKLQPNKKAGQVILRFKYYKKNYPNTTNGWSSMESGKTWQTVEIDTIPPASFNGPSQICDEGIYTITNPGTITLENASGIATLTALGNNQWKVTRTGTANGIVKLRSTSNGKIFEKDIVLGIPAPTISGTSQINTVGEYNYIVSRNTPGSTIEYNLMLGGDVELIPVSDTEFKIKVVNPNTSGSNMIVKVRARETNSCGTSSYTIKNITLNGNM
jgi:hypothetical protein